MIESVAIFVTVVLGFVGVRFLLGTKSTEKENNPDEDIGPEVGSLDSLKQHTEEFKPELLHLDNCHVAIGYGLYNGILLEGKWHSVSYASNGNIHDWCYAGTDGCILIGGLDSLESALEVKKQFESIVREKPIKAIVLTQFQPNNGIEAFIDSNPEIYAHASFGETLEHDSIDQRRMRLFGHNLPRSMVENSGIGITQTLGSLSKDVNPTKIFESSLDISHSGINLHLYHAPGQSRDQVNVWWAEKEMHFPGSNIYKAFPNVSGSSARYGSH